MDIDLSVDYEEGLYCLLGMLLCGGMMLIIQGGVLYWGSLVGSICLLVDIDGIVDVFVSGNDLLILINIFGKVVIVDVGSYLCSLVCIDLNKLLEKVEVIKLVVQIMFIEGVIGYCYFDVVSGEKMMVVFWLVDGDFLLFGVEVKNECQQQLGLVVNDGNVWLVGVKVGEILKVFWDGVVQCEVLFLFMFILELLVNVLLLLCKILEGQFFIVLQKSFLLFV